MSKELNTVLFVLGGVLLNLLLMGSVFLGSVILLARVFSGVMSDGLLQILLVVSLLLSIGVSLFVYYRVVRWLQKKIDFDQYFVAFMRGRGPAGNEAKNMQNRKKEAEGYSEN